ncbi:undecaprenyl-diphosphate phosphatase [uncultured Ralstonia sp.]|jgi:undecaprenyl-diphosphatase|uniref:undecaprenyl-diphosphate phosphatase n=1 Tax=Ralstonia sp. TaxID=54061 RepID=UPI001EA891BF|nr:undecaprenyl-diphosphate phosphatase [uncultured Ralstonia sp.]UCF24571.1 MAG: undecaprenyl-diphosphate phosphatase [Ralstonia sp.]
MNTLHILILACVQGIAELLPVSSSAHVILAEKWLGLDPTSPDMTLLLVMLHTGTMFAVIVYFWRSWRQTYFSSAKALWDNGVYVAVATVATGIVGLTLLYVIKHTVMRGAASFEVEHLFGNTKLMAVSLAVAGVLIIVSSRRAVTAAEDLTGKRALWIGAVQGLCLPFRGLSRSGATISSGMLLGVQRRRAEEFSFALAVVLTPAVIAKEGYRFYQAYAGATDSLLPMLAPSLLGMAASFVAGLVALRWLSRWLEQGRWYLFGCYCLVASVAVWTFGG